MRPLPEDFDELLAALERERDPKPRDWRMLQQRTKERREAIKARQGLKAEDQK
jgi:hypothetical protein